MNCLTVAMSAAPDLAGSNTLKACAHTSTPYSQHQQPKPAAQQRQQQERAGQDAEMPPASAKLALAAAPRFIHAAVQQRGNPLQAVVNTAAIAAEAATMQMTSMPDASTS
jgi:hypothetical protein